MKYRFVGLLPAFFACLCAAVACQPSSHTTAPATLKVPAGRLAGFSVPGYPPDPAAFESAESATGVHANIVSWYTSIGTPFSASRTARIAGHGTLPLIEIDSDTTPLKDIVDGRWDTFFTAYARGVAAYRSPVAIDFDHEFNGDWSPWGPRANTPQAFVDAWRRIVTIFRRSGAGNVIWVWNPNIIAPDVAAMKPWYPGDQYVTWVGIDGYFFSPRDTFATVFPATLRALNSFTSKRVLVVETGVLPGPRRASQIKSLFAGLEATPQIIGFIWFDYDKGAGHNWRLEGDRGALAAFHEGVVTYQKIKP